MGMVYGALYGNVSGISLLGGVRGIPRSHVISLLALEKSWPRFWTHLFLGVGEITYIYIYTYVYLRNRTNGPSNDAVDLFESNVSGFRYFGCAGKRESVDEKEYVGETWSCSNLQIPEIKRSFAKVIPRVSYLLSVCCLYIVRHCRLHYARDITHHVGSSHFFSSYFHFFVFFGG